MRPFIVKWSKQFVSGPLKGIWYDSQLDFADLGEAIRYVEFLRSHKNEPVKSIGGGDYLCHISRLVVH
jgi:hypothetical protein